eukprot:jgi/Tetstr1/453174/TSEL_040191.t1
MPEDSDDNMPAGGAYRSPTASHARSNGFYGADSIMGQSAATAQHGSAWHEQHSFVVAQGRHRDLPVCAQWIGPEANECTFKEWYEDEFREEVRKELVMLPKEAGNPMQGPVWPWWTRQIGSAPLR